VAELDPQAPPVLLKVLADVPANNQYSEQDVLNARLNDALDDKMQLKKNLADAQKRANDAEGRLAIAENQKRQMEVSLEQLNRYGNRDMEIRSLRENERTMTAKFKQLEIALKTAKSKEAEAQEGVLHLKEENRYWMEKVKQYEADLKQTQEKSIREMSDGRWNPIPDKDIRDGLYVLNQDVRDWAKKWASGPMKLDSMPPETRKDFIQSFLSRFVRLDSTGSLPPGVAYPTTRIKDKMPWLLLGSALADEIQHQFFRSPFFCADAKHREALEETYKELIRGSASLAYLRPSTNLKESKSS
jgi:hypothetical protein